MREIKFRAWDKAREEMINVDILLNTQNRMQQYRINRPKINGVLDVEFIKEDTVLMQYTGLKDKNGVEIYEGDIVGHNGFIGYVKYINSGNCNVLGYALVSLINGRIFYMFCDETDNYEVIGNIHENQELLN